MIDLPKWLSAAVDNFSCPHCKEQMSAKCVSGIGIKTSSKYKDRSVLFFEHTCNKCHNKVFVEMDFMNVEEFVMKMVDEYSEDSDEDSGEVSTTKSKTDSSSNEKKYGKKKAYKSKISQEEVDGFLDILSKCEYWDDVLTNIGLTKEDIELNTKKIKEEKDSKDSTEKQKKEGNA